MPGEHSQGSSVVEQGTHKPLVGGSNPSLGTFQTHTFMANIKSAKKRALQSERRRAKNTSVITALKSSQKKLKTAIAGGKTDEAREEFVKLTSSLDKAAKRGIIHKNSANRKKGILTKALKKAA